METVILKNGRTTLWELYLHVMSTLYVVEFEDTFALWELASKARNPAYRIKGSFWILLDHQLILPDGNLLGPIRDIVLCAFEGDGSFNGTVFNLRIVIPLKGI